MDKLEKFVSQNKEQFDVLEPSPLLWNGVRERSILMKNRRLSLNHPLVKWSMRIAAAVVIFVASYYWHDFQSQRSERLLSQDQLKPSLLTDLLEAGYYYNAKINVETERFYKATADNNSLRDEIQTELDELDQEFLKLKQDLMDNADNEDVIAAMIQTYRLKLSILQDILSQLQSENSGKNISDENIPINI
ncbi:MAG: hypothetical protein PHG67_01130 [Bacteroidales bacterium]|nr:hypothetical protein [Bacteroidales bacterium]